MENWDEKPEKKKAAKAPKKFTIYPIRQQDDYYVPPKQLIAPFDELVNKGGGNLLLIGPPSSGKSVYANNLILSEEAFKDCFEMMYCISPCINDDLSSCYLKDAMDFVETEYSEELMKGIYDNIMSVPVKERKLSLVFLDDCLDSFKQHRDFISKVTATIRHMKTVCIFSLQKLFGVPTGLRANVTLSVIYYIPSHKEYKQVEQFHSFFGGEENFKTHYQEATKIRYGCLLCDFRNLRLYRHGANTVKPELVWAKYSEDGSEWNGPNDSKVENNTDNKNV